MADEQQPDTTSIWSFENLKAHGTYIPLMVGVISLVALMILPLPPILLDTLLALNITISILILLTSVYVNKPLEFSVLPSLLLMATLFRLALNVASTRRILLGAANGNSDVSHIIETFGHFVVGGNTLVGIVVFLILVVINYMVITKGAERIAEVAARFTLDALPGKQMSIDAELASGSLTEAEARQKRREVERESDFYGAMDGASKFVRGDAIAGLIITGINIAGGLLIGMVQGGLTFAEAAQTYTLLTVGDGLVTQIPALFISTANGLIVTRAASSAELQNELSGQVFGDPRVLYGATVVLLLLGLVPGMPFLIFSSVAAVIGYTGYQASLVEQKEAQMEAEEQLESEQEEPEEGDEEDFEQLLDIETLSLEIGFGLVSLVDEDSDGTLLNRLVEMRRRFARELGIIVPSIHIRDNLNLEAGEYRLLLKGVPIGSGEIKQGSLLAIDPGGATGDVDGVETTDPTFGLDALWIDPSDRHKAEAAGYTVVEQDAVITTHVSELVEEHASELLGWQELEQRLEDLKEEAPKLIEELIPERMSFGNVLSVLRRLLDEGVSVRDLRTILEALAENAHGEASITSLTDAVRERLARQISSKFMDENEVINAALLGRQLEDRLRQSVVQQRGEPVLACDLNTAQNIFGQIEEALPEFAVKDAEPVILAPPDLRGALYKFLTQFFPDINVLSHREVISEAELVGVAEITLDEDGSAEAQGEPPMGQTPTG